MRLFVALELSPAARDALLQAQEALKKQGRGNFTRRENLHLTLAFIGETQRLDAARDALRAIQSKAFTLHMEKIGAFDDLIWAGAELSPPLAALQKEVEHLLRVQGFTLEKRAFRPHITLCRRFAPFGKRDLIAAQHALGSIKSAVTRVVLMESLRIDGKLVYRSVESKNL